MSTIRCIYSVAPNFPATDQHPDAVRYQVGGRFVDAIGGQPTQAEVDAVLNPAPKATAVSFDERQADAKLEDMEAAIDAGQTDTALRIAVQLLREKS